MRDIAPLHRQHDIVFNADHTNPTHSYRPNTMVLYVASIPSVCDLFYGMDNTDSRVLILGIVELQEGSGIGLDHVRAKED